MSGLLYSTTDAETNSSTRITDTLAESNKYHDLPERNNECSRYQNTTSLTMSVDMDVEGESVKSGRRQKESNQEDGMVLSIQEAVRKFYSTTSSVYAEHTISNPNAEQILFWWVKSGYFCLLKWQQFMKRIPYFVTLLKVSSRYSLQYFNCFTGTDIRWYQCIIRQ